LALVAAVAGPLPLVLDMRLGIAMSDAAMVLWPLSILLVIASALVAQSVGDRYFVKTVLVSLVAEYMATATYDSSRIAGISAGVTPMDEALDFGMRLSGQIAPGAGHATHGEQTAQSAEAEIQATTAPHRDEHQAQAPSAPHGDEHEAQAPSAPQADEHQAQAPSATQADEHQAQAPSVPQTDEHQAQAPSAPHEDQHGVQAPTAQPGTVALGYAWHYWAGMMFSLSYLVLFGTRHWWAAIPYTLIVIYTGMVVTMGVHSPLNFVWEAIGHAGFGLTLGIVSYALLARRESPYAT
jgi:hypothetical protein